MMHMKKIWAEVYTLPVDNTSYLGWAVFIDKYIVRMQVVMP
jgi:hypothetical protein